MNMSVAHSTLPGKRDLVSPTLSDQTMAAAVAVAVAAAVSLLVLALACECEH